MLDMQNVRHVAQNAGNSTRNDGHTMQNVGWTTQNVGHNTHNVCLGPKGGGLRNLINQTKPISEGKENSLLNIKVVSNLYILFCLSPTSVATGLNVDYLKKSLGSITIGTWLQSSSFYVLPSDSWSFHLFLLSPFKDRKSMLHYLKSI